MSGGAVRALGSYHDAQRPIASPVEVTVDGDEAQFVGARLACTHPLHRLRVSPRIGRSDRFITLPDGGQVQCGDDALLARLPSAAGGRVVDWLEQRWPVALVCVLLSAAALLNGYLYGLPVVAQALTDRISLDSERALGEGSLAWLDDNAVLTPSALSAAERDRIRDRFGVLSAGQPLQRYHRLEFRASESLGANAFALPGGIVVITDAMVRLAASENEIAAVLAHELGHVEHRDALRELLQSSALGLMAGGLTLDAGAVGSASTAGPLLVVTAGYSRAFERDADDFAFERLRQTHVPPAVFAALLERLEAQPEHQESAYVTYLSSHPLTADRVARARAADAPN